MTNTSEILFSLAAVTIFSIFTLNAYRGLVSNTERNISSKTTHQAVSLAESTLEEAKWASFDELEPGTAQYRFQDYPKDVVTKEGTYTIDVSIQDIALGQTDVNHKEVAVTVTHRLLNSPVELTYIQSQP